MNDATALDQDDFITVISAELHCLGKAYDQDGVWHIVANGLPADFTVANNTETGPEPSSPRRGRWRLCHHRTSRMVFDDDRRSA